MAREKTEIPFIMEVTFVNCAENITTLPEQDISLAVTFSGVSMSLIGHAGWRYIVVK